MKRIFIGFTLLITLFSCNTPSKEVVELQSGFQNPPESARPRVWWHWMNGNITKDGIKADLEWMHRIGIGGFQNFDASLMTPQVVEKRLIYMTPEWKDAFLFTTKLADSLGLEMAIAGSPGWSESGGPWVKPSQAMKKYVWSETKVDGGKPFSGKLAEPPSTTGPFQNLAIRRSSIPDINENKVPSFYADAAVFAYKVPDADITMAILKPRVTSSGGSFDLVSLTDGDLTSSSLLPPKKPGENAWIQFEFSKPVTIQGMTIVGGGFGGMFGYGADPDNRTLEWGDDGKTFTGIINISKGGIEQRTLTFKPVTARYFRVNWKTPQPQPAFSFGTLFGESQRQSPQAPAGTKVAELVLHPIPVINDFEEKAAFSAGTHIYSTPTPKAGKDIVINRNEVVDLTSKMKPDGSLDWEVPDGKWTIVRLGYSLTGHQNSPASPEATGLEVDKLSARHVKDYFNNYLDQYKDATGGLMGKRGLQYVITDSWEAGVQNWTDDMINEFSKRRGYDMLQWMPVLTGKIVESSAASDNFLWDLRKTIGDLTVENHYDQLTTILKERGMGRYSESHESGRALIADGMEIKKNADVPMSATWTPGGFTSESEVSTGYKADVRESASVSHIYGQKFVAAESLTAIGTAWAWSPETLKPTADMELSNGLNRFVIHTSVHQPLNDKIPGLGLGPFGQWFTRHETWAEQAAPWITYLSRSSFMLQQGKFIADIAYFYGEDNNITSLFGSKLPDIPASYNYDFINADALINVLSVENGQLVTPAGASYRILVLDTNSVYMSLPVLRKLRDLVNNGAVVSGPKPLASTGLSDNGEEFKSIVAELWADSQGFTSVGKGRVYSGLQLSDVLSQLEIKPDFKYTKTSPDTKLLFVHRALGNVNFYWVNNRNNRDEDVECSFRITGMAPEIWHPETGKIEQVSYMMNDGVTNVKLHLSPADAVFVVFSNKTGKKSLELAVPIQERLADISNSWDLSFQKNRGAPDAIKVNALESWPDNSDPGVKYFSGTGTYSKVIDAPGDWFKKGARTFIDLGDVKNLAEVVINGKSLGVAWKKPFRVDVTGELKEGSNNIVVKVTNLWVNRLIGDAQPGVTNKITYTTIPFYRADSKLMQSGLLGPVQIISQTN